MKWATVRSASIHFCALLVPFAAVYLIPSGAALAQAARSNLIFDSRTYGIEGNYPYAGGITLTPQDNRETIGPVDLTGGQFLNIGRVTPQPNVSFMLSFRLNDQDVTYYTSPEEASGSSGIKLPEQADLSASLIEIVGLSNQAVYVSAFTITVEPTPVDGHGATGDPVADAGTYPPVEADRPGAAGVTLDGTDSTDPGGGQLTYEWTGHFGTVAGAQPTVSLPLGTHTVTLTVANGSGATDQDTAQVVVRDTTGPAVTCRLDAASTTQRSGKTTKRTFRVVLGATDVADPAPSIAGDLNGHVVTDGMLVELVLQEGTEGTSCATKPDGTLVMLSEAFALTGTAGDASGNSAQQTCAPVFGP